VRQGGALDADEVRTANLANAWIAESAT